LTFFANELQKYVTKLNVSALVHVNQTANGKIV